MITNSFKRWIDESDMPTFIDGEWIDLETGIPYAPAKQSLSESALNARNTAKNLGGKALKGTAKQKEWAENIRAEKIAQMTQEQAVMAVDPNGLLTNAKFWIENRNNSGKQIGLFVQQQKALLKKAQTLKARGAAEEYAQVASEYNSLTKKWGWN